MNLNNALIQLRASLALNGEKDAWHSIPIYGKPHEPNAECWCQPETDHIDSRIYIHHPSQ